MTKRFYYIILCIFLFSAFRIHAQTQIEMNQTAYGDYQKADAKLNKLYQRVLKILNGKEKELLIKAQRDWIAFRDSHCKFEIQQYDGGSIQPLIYSNCLTERTNARIEDLKAILEDEAR